MTFTAVPLPRVYALALAALFLSLVSSLGASPAEMAFAALQADAKESFGKDIKPFLETYCTKCHGSRRMKGGINFAPALKDPGSTASSRQWKYAIATVKSHDKRDDGS